MAARSWLAELSHNVRFLRYAVGVLATLSLALVVAATIARDPPEFSSTPVVAVLRDNEQRPVWAVRLARSAHQIAADSLRIETAPSGHAYELWLLAANAASPRQLGTLPQSGRKPIAVSPQTARRLAGMGELVVTLEPLGGARGQRPSGPVVFRGTLESGG